MGSLSLRPSLWTCIQAHSAGASPEMSHLKASLTCPATGRVLEAVHSLFLALSLSFPPFLLLFHSFIHSPMCADSLASGWW